MALRPILEVPDPRLRAMSEPVADVDDAVRALVADMLETMYDAPGIGLAAIQIGVPRRVLVIDLQEDGPDGERIRHPQAFINPELYDFSDETSVYNEGCLSIPEQYADVTRPAAVSARWLDEQGTAHDTQVEGLLATCLQHEVDHLNGVLFTDHISKLKRDMLLKKLAKVQKGRRAA